jgi:hypothetical protein
VDELTIVAARPGPQLIAIAAPGEWELVPSSPATKLAEARGALTLTLGENVTHARLRRK